MDEKKYYLQCMCQLIEVHYTPWLNNSYFKHRGIPDPADTYYLTQAWELNGSWFNTGWSWLYHEKTRLTLGDFDPKRYKYDNDVQKICTNIAKELNVIFAKVLPEELIIRLWLEVCL